MGERYQRSPRPGSIALNHFYDIDLIKTSPRIPPSFNIVMSLAHLQVGPGTRRGVRPARGTRVHGSSCQTFLPP